MPSLNPWCTARRWAAARSMRACRSAEFGTVILFGEITFIATILRLAGETALSDYPSSRRISTQSHEGHASAGGRPTRSAPMPALGAESNGELDSRPSRLHRSPRRRLQQFFELLLVEFCAASGEVSARLLARGDEVELAVLHLLHRSLDEAGLRRVAFV